MFKKNRNKDCVLCNSKRINNEKLCNECLKLKSHIRNYGIMHVLQSLRIYGLSPSAPPTYNNNT
jgi:hypothetical protein